MTRPPKHHRFKIHPQFFELHRFGLKDWELRLGDRVVQVGDTCDLEEWDPATSSYTGQSTGQRLISYVLRPQVPPATVAARGLAPGWCIFTHRAGWSAV